jgi:hypothetical protein
MMTAVLIFSCPLVRAAIEVSVQKTLGIALVTISTMVSAAAAYGQRGLGAGVSFGHFGAPPISNPRPGTTITFRTPGQRGFGHGFSPGSFFWGYPFFPDYSDYQPSAPSQPQVIVLQTPPSSSELRESPAPVPAPLLIELQGDRYVRYSNASQTVALGERPAPADSLESTAPRTKSGKAAADQSQGIPAVVLAFRDGHREEVGSYAIIGKTMYVASDYWTTGTWQKQVLLVDLDLPQTSRLNDARGVRFVLPSAPNEVVTRP